MRSVEAHIMRTRIGRTILISMIMAGCAIRTATPVVVPDDWSVVQSIPRHSQVRVVFRWRESLVGSIESSDASRIELAIRGRVREFRRTDVIRVLRREGRQTAKYRKRGTLVGLAAGALLIASEKDVSAFGLLMTAYWTGLGAGVGAVSGYFTPGETLVYQAPLRPAK